METKALFAIAAMCVLAGCSGGYGPTEPSPADSTYSAGYTFVLAGLDPINDRALGETLD